MSDENKSKDELAMPVDQENSLFVLSEKQHQKMGDEMRRQFLSERSEALLPKSKVRKSPNTISAKDYAEHLLGDSLTEAEFQPVRPSIASQKLRKS